MIDKTMKLQLLNLIEKYLNFYEFMLYYPKLMIINCKIDLNELNLELIKDVIIEDIKSKINNFSAFKYYCEQHDLDYDLTVEDIKKLLNKAFRYRIEEIAEAYYEALRYIKFAPLHTVN
jgi:hypothetical protein